MGKAATPPKTVVDLFRIFKQAEGKSGRTVSWYDERLLWLVREFIVHLTKSHAIMHGYVEINSGADGLLTGSRYWNDPEFRNGILSES